MLSRIKRLFGESCEDCAFFISSRANVFYYSGFTSDDAFLIITENERYIITDSRYFVQARLEAPEFELVDIKKGWKTIFEGIRHEKIYFEEDNLSYGMYSTVTGNTDGKAFYSGQKLINYPRRFKDKAEIDVILQAEQISDEAFSYILNVLRAGISEREVAFELESYMRKQGADGLSFETIVASGVRSAMPHGAASEKIIEKGDFVTMDFGCVYKGYCSDMTRTVVIGKPDEKQKEIYDIVLNAQEKAIAAVALGTGCSDIDKVARDYISDRGYGDNFSHSLGHSVGVEIHELPVFSPKSEDILQNGNVLSVEPGIYIDGLYGARIEDLIAVYDNKIVNLTNSPKELVAL